MVFDNPHRKRNFDQTHFLSYNLICYRIDQKALPSHWHRHDDFFHHHLVDDDIVHHHLDDAGHVHPVDIVLDRIDCLSCLDHYNNCDHDRFECFVRARASFDTRVGRFLTYDDDRFLLLFPSTICYDGRPYDDHVGSILGHSIVAASTTDDDDPCRFRRRYLFP